MRRPDWTGQLPLIGSALFVAFIIWLMAQQSNLEAQQIKVRVVLQNVPPNVACATTPNSVDIMVKFPHPQRPSVLPARFEVRLDVKELFGGDPRTWAGIEKPTVHPPYTITLDNIHTIDLPQSVRVTEINSSPQIQIEAKLLSQELPVRVVSSGKVPENYRTAEIRPQPPTLRVTGSNERLSRLTGPEGELTTAPVRLDERTEDFIEFVEVQLPSEVELVDTAVKKIQVVVDVEELTAPRTFSEVPVSLFVFQEGLAAAVDPPLAEVTVTGRISILGRITADMFVFSSKRHLVEEAGTKHEVELAVTFDDETPDDIRKNILIEGVKPAKVNVEFVRKSPEETSPAATDGAAEGPPAVPANGPPAAAAQPASGEQGPDR